MSHSLKPAKNAAEISVLDNADADAESMVFLALPADAITTYKMPCRNTMVKICVLAVFLLVFFFADRFCYVLSTAHMTNLRTKLKKLTLHLRIKLLSRGDYRLILKKNLIVNFFEVMIFILRY